MSDLIFIQRSQFGRSIFALRGDKLEITSYLFRQKSSAEIPIRSISSNYVADARRLSALVIIPLILAAGCIGIIRLVVGHDSLPDLLIWYPVMFAAVFLFAAIRGARRVEYYSFTDHWKRPLFSFIREREQAEECDAFVRELLDRIERVEQNLPASVPDQPATVLACSVRMPTGDPGGKEQRAEHQWKLAIAAGALSAAFPVITLAIRELAVWDVAVVVVSCAGCTVAATFSFSAGERKRYWALLGIALAITPLLFY